MVFVLRASEFLQILEGSNNFSWKKDRPPEKAWEKVSKSIIKAHLKCLKQTQSLIESELINEIECVVEEKNSSTTLLINLSNGRILNS